MTLHILRRPKALASSWVSSVLIYVFYLLAPSLKLSARLEGRSMAQAAVFAALCYWPLGPNSPRGPAVLPSFSSALWTPELSAPLPCLRAAPATSACVPLSPGPRQQVATSKRGHSRSFRLACPSPSATWKLPPLSLCLVAPNSGRLRDRFCRHRAPEVRPRAQGGRPTRTSQTPGCSVLHVHLCGYTHMHLCIKRYT